MSDIGLLGEIREDVFFANWEDRFQDNWEKYITPQQKMVVEWSNDAVETTSRPDKEIAETMWLYVYDNTEYKLSKKWKTPLETIKSRIGDCEDFTFLLASMFPNAGITTSKVALGEVKFPTGYSEYHTWNIVDGKVIDATGTPESVKKVKYKKTEEWKVNKR